MAGSIGCLLLVVQTSTAGAAALFAATHGSDSNPGTLARPWRTVTASLNKLIPGDTLYVRAGTYFESPVAARSGTAGFPIVVRSYPGERVILDSGHRELQTPGNSEWQLVNAAIGEYRTKRTYGAGDIYAYVAGIPDYENGRVVLVPYAAESHFRSTTDVYNSKAFYVGPGTFRNADGRIHVRLAKTPDMRAIESRYGRVFAEDLPNPAQYAIILSQASHTLRISGSYWVFKDLELNQAKRTILLEAGAHDLRFEGMTVWMGNRCISVTGAGVHHITVTGSRLYGDAPLWVFWSDMKDAPYPADRLRGTSVDLRHGTHDWEIAYCHIRGSGQDLIGTNQNEYNIKIHHNRIENAADDGLELEGKEDVGRIEVYENYIANCLTAIAPGQDSPKFTGPLLVYRNVISLLRNPPVNRATGINRWNGGGRFGYEYMFKHGTGASYNTRNAHYYHNTLVLLNSTGRGINISPKFPEHARIANNLMVVVNGRVNGPYTKANGQVVDGNLYWKMNTVDTLPLVDRFDTVAQLRAASGLESKGLGSTRKRGTDPQFASPLLEVVDRTKTQWLITARAERKNPADFLIGPSSPARGAGVSIPVHPTVGVLPDTRKSRDIGALPFGTQAREFRRFPFDPGAVRASPGDTSSAQPAPPSKRSPQANAEPDSQVGS